MLAKTGKLWWLVILCAFLAGVCAYPVVVWGLYAATTVTEVGKQMYIGRTTVMESIGTPVKGQPDDYKTRLANLGNLATSQRVLSNAAQTLSELGMKFTPQQVLSGTSVVPIKDTNILAIEVTLPDAKEAKVAADVIASEFKKVYAETSSAPLSHSREFFEAQIRPTREAMIRAQDALNRCKQQKGVALPEKEAKIAVLTVDLKSATDTYGLMRSKLDEAKIREQQSRSKVALKTIDPAFVRPAPRLNIAGSLLSFITNPIFGPVIGVIIGLALGLMLAALIRNRRQPISHQQGV